MAFIHLTPPQAINLERMLSRQGHYMKAGMLDSQLEILEELGTDEYGVKIDNPGSPEAVEADIVNWVKAQGLISNDQKWKGRLKYFRRPFFDGI